MTATYAVQHAMISPSLIGLQFEQQWQVSIETSGPQNQTHSTSFFFLK